MPKMESTFRTDCGRRRSFNYISVTALVLLLTLLSGAKVEALTRAAVVAPVAAPTVTVTPPKAAPAPVAAPTVTVTPPKAAPAPVVATPPKAVPAPVVAAPTTAPAPVVATPPTTTKAPVVAPNIAPVAAKVPTPAPKTVTPVAAPATAPSTAPVTAPTVAGPATAPVVAPVASGPATAPATAPAAALTPSTGVPLDAAQVKALNALGIIADANACSTIPTTEIQCDRNATTQHLVSLNAQDCKATATLTDASLAAIAPYLKDLSFLNCPLQDALPQPTSRMAQTLTSLTVTGAPNLAGWWIGRLVSLKTLHIRDTSVTASNLNVIVSNLPGLTDLTIANSSMTGPLPTDWPATTMTTLDLSGNQLSGSIPIGITKMASLTSLDLSSNHLNDHIISGLGDLTQLTTLSLSHNQLHLGIPKTLGNLHYLQHLDLSFNDLNGTVPDSLAQLPLTYLDLSNNSLSGPIPFDDLFLSKLTTFKFAGNPDLCYNSTITSSKAAAGLPLCGASLVPLSAPEPYGPAMAPTATGPQSGAGPPKKKPKVVVVVFATLGALVAVGAIVYFCCRYWGAKAGYA